MLARKFAALLPLATSALAWKHPLKLDTAASTYASEDASSTATSASADASSTPGAYPVSVIRDPNSSDTGFGFTHAQNQEYTARITINGVDYQVILDTGSSDTWIDPDSVGGMAPPNLIHTGINSTTSYVDGSSATGEIVLANITFGPYTVVNQAFTTSYGGAADSPGLWNGLIGLGGALGSQIMGLVENTTYAENGIPILYNLFDHEPTMPDYAAWYMSRSDVGISDGGVLTISEVLSNMTDVVKAPVLASPAPGAWTSYLEDITVNGQSVPQSTVFADHYLQQWNTTVPSNTSVACFDTGTSFIMGPLESARAIYAMINGAQEIDGGGGNYYYSVPCDTKVNITWTFGGVTYPMHPIEVAPPLVDANGTTCLGAISAGAVPEADWLLGAAFLRNMYALYDYSSGMVNVPGYSQTYLDRPTTQLLSIVDPDQAWMEVDAMIAARLSAHQADYSSTVAAPLSAGTARPTFTGSDAPESVTAVNNDLTDSSSMTMTDSDYAASATATGDSLAATATDTFAVLAAAAASTSDAASGPVYGPNWSVLVRNSYIIMALLAGVVILLLAVLALVVRANRRTREYRPIGGGHSGGYSDGHGSYSTPYDK
ncbi:aspartic peptidase domain-containing protein [Epithele typhae]|uniref:aspartic peptidase domain-containing protein n=1 Tax=Epithele typhae TaxID=378194 RepID=UPI0020081F15|nr:aspartic peptidase domain-containing protein [Epithele typhae]KAH9934492.1 aspartic peptidase domain-containing protein [Epithele typhae]